MFKLPIEYRKSYPTQGAMIQDLELCVAEEGPSMLECVFEPKTTLARKMLPKWAAQYTDAYKSVNYFALVYNDGAGNFICDEFNGGTGFLNNRAYLR